MVCMIYMAVSPMYCKISYKDHLLTQKALKQSVRDFTCHYTAIQEGCRCFSSVSIDAGRRWLNDATDIFLKTNARKTAGCRRPHCHLIFSSDNASSQRDNVHNVQLASESSSNELQLRSLDSYFRKLQNDFNQPSSDLLNKNVEFSDKSGQFKAKNLLGSLDDYLGKVNGDPKTKNYMSSTSAGGNTEASYSVREDTGRGRWKKIKNYMKLEDKDGLGGPESSYDDTSDLYLISILVSINIAVFLFEIASPVRNSDLELFSLPLMYGAKINHLIKIGQWWRLLTPMFLHSGVLHVALSCWVLLTFGPRVCRTYGSFTFFLIYILGGISGNLTSFLHTPEPTVGGTGPIFAIIGAWLVYQIQNKDVTAKDVSESMFQKAVIATALSFTLSNFGPIDDWAHFGAAFAGILYGSLVCPTLQVEDTSKAGQEEGIALVRRRYADPCKSLLVFSLFVLLLSCLLFVIEPPIYSPEVDTFE